MKLRAELEPQLQADNLGQGAGVKWPLEQRPLRGLEWVWPAVTLPI